MPIKFYRTSRTALVVILGLIAVICIRSCGDPSWTKDNIEKSKKDGDSIVAALAAYRAKGGLFPESLDQLTPSFISKLPLPSAGDGRWLYEVSEDRSSFNLSFAERRKHPEKYYFTPEHNQWVYADEAF